MTIKLEIPFRLVKDFQLYLFLLIYLEIQAYVPLVCFKKSFSFITTTATFYRFQGS